VKAPKPPKAVKLPAALQASAPKFVSRPSVPVITHFERAARLAASDKANTDDESVLVSPARGRRKLGIGRSKMAEMIATGEIKSVLIGRSRRIPISEIWRIAKHGCA
jgi:excisionase family DNA binding protein